MPARFTNTIWDFLFSISIQWQSPNLTFTEFEASHRETLVAVAYPPLPQNNWEHVSKEWTQSENNSAAKSASIILKEWWTGLLSGGSIVSQNAAKTDGMAHWGSSMINHDLLHFCLNSNTK